MWPASYLLFGLAVFGRVALCDYTQWMTTTWIETAWQTKAAETMWSTEWSVDWSTTTCWSTEKASTVTVYDTSTTTEYETSTTTIEVTTTDTVVKSYESEVTTTVTIVPLGSTVIVPGKGYTSTILVENTKTITQACSLPPTSTLSGLVVCPRSTTNTAYAPPTPLPNDYLWGCPPGELCKPPQIGCNFAADLPGPDYICSPEDCIPAEPVPPAIGGPFVADFNSTCPWYETYDDYYNLPPALFGLSYTMFAVSSLGIAAGDCPPTPVAPPPPPPSSTTTTVPPPPPPPPPPSTTTTVPPPPPPPPSTTEWLPWTTSSKTWASWSPPAPVSSSSSWAEWVHSSSAAAVYSSASTWADWQSASSHAPYAPGITSPPRLLARDDFVCPMICYQYCNYAGVVGQGQGLKSADICAPNCPFSVAYDQCQSCIAANKHNVPLGVQLLVTDLNTFLNFCAGIKAPATPPVPVNGPPTTTSTPKLTPVTTTTKSPIQSQQTTTTSTPASPSTTTTTPSTSVTTTPSVVPTSPTTVCAISQISDGQPQATDCILSVTSPTSPTVSINSITSSGAQPTQGPAAGLIVGVVAIMAMV